MKKFLAFAFTAVMLTSCVSDKQIKEVILKDPNLIADAIKKHPAEIMMALQTAARDAKDAMAKKRAEEEQKKLLESIDKPLVPEIRDDEAIRGTKGAPITLVEYSDFQCPYCTRGFTDVVAPLLEKYKGKVAFVYKHLPLSFHAEARMAAAYYEGMRLQKPELAFKFHDELFKQDAQAKLRTHKERFLKKLAKKLGADMNKLAKDVKSDAVKKRIEADEAEARKFGIQGTPGFLLNGVPIKGAYPLSYFENILGKLKEKGKINL
ncbi:thioredoxin domain-containing protein [Bacteriovorax sp. DB6_IX]|uniref:DsbA family protein n=1 Tax=Bacteriovorax sp. DB6_IX TaxID=1353530 RepID=UPI00038A104F|nr:thioredoxin domain-containing protein [Bacteriovorax sp. DB6_IX]EQC52709.1 DSBA-like thioredoxin domain protein [Bacteriovorax sp. DB6_IX]